VALQALHELLDRALFEVVRLGAFVSLVDAFSKPRLFASSMQRKGRQVKCHFALPRNPDDVACTDDFPVRNGE